ncbi:MAG TPA: antibiotic biosynthesis monooxygenase family protein [Nitrososphaeraceae archaeon]
MIKFVEMDKIVTINDQIKEEQGNKNGDSVILINKFDVSPDKIEQFLKDWAETSSLFEQQPGFITTELYKGIGKSSVYVSYQVWKSIDDFKKGSSSVLNSDDVNSRLAKYNDSLVISSHLFRKAVVPGINKD